ncbi:F-box protein [Phanerochaete sordida]|uniref:F-box protein n=1 Tax=Phanerochaete sordida TaxID=48140 RepID=A0A9P3GI55_9APHY|nr:F-box protein [Phanerochaete sordida]
MACDLVKAAIPATSLPPELLGRIFEEHIQLCKDDWDHEASPEPQPPSCYSQIGPYTWIRATHVCRYWRDVALANPLLWSHIVLANRPDCIETLLERSQQVPLSVQSYTSPCAADACLAPARSLRLVLAHLPRIRTLTLAIKWWVFLDIADTLHAPAPALARLTLATPSGLPDAAYMQPELRAPAGPLRHLALRAFAFPWAAPAPFRGLHTLRVARAPAHRPDAPQVLAALAHMPALRALALDDVFYPSPPGAPLPHPPPHHARVRLPRLAALALAGDALACAALLQGLSIPATARLALGYHRTTAPADLARALAGARAAFTREADADTHQAGLEESRVAPREIAVGGLRCRVERCPTAYACYLWRAPRDAGGQAGAGAFDDADLVVRIPHHPAHREVLLRELPVRVVGGGEGA